MMLTLADSSIAIPISIYKPIVLLAVVTGWAWVVSKLDKDALNHYLPRAMWNGIQMGAAAVALLQWLLIPTAWWFWVGLPIAVLILGGGILAYAFYRNSKVSEDQQWTMDLASFKQQVQEAHVARTQAKAALHLCQPNGARLPAPGGDDPNAAPHTEWEQVLEFALPRKADRIDLSVAGAAKASLVVHIDGVRYPQTAPEGRLALAMIDYFKHHGALDVSDRRRRQSGTLLIDAEGQGRHTLGLITAGSTRELMLSVRIDSGKRLVLPLDKIGLLDTQRQLLAPVFANGKGVVLVACPPHQGLTTTLYSFLHQHDPYTQSVVTLEDTIDLEIEGANQHTIDPGADAAALSQKVAALLRADPQVLMISRIGEPQVVKTVLASADEVRCYGGLPLDDSFAALRAWIKLAGDPRPAAGKLAAIVSQRLVRKLCPTCRIAFRPDPGALKKLNLTADRATNFFKQSGQVMVKNKPEPCPTCLGMGFQGRTGVFEVMVLDDPGRALIVAGQLDQFRAHVRKQRMLWMQEAGVAKVAAGITSIAEITRVLAPKPATPKGAAAG